MYMYIHVCVLYIHHVYIYTFIDTYLYCPLYILTGILWSSFLQHSKDVDVHSCIYINSSEMYGMSCIFAVFVLLGFFQFGRTKL